MRKAFLSHCLVLLTFYLCAQVSEDFATPNWNDNEQWVGDVSKFLVENGRLQLSDTQAGAAYLATSNTMLSDTQWDFWVRLAFTPSNSNHPKIYLVSDTSDLMAPLNGYYIRIGKDGTDNKRLYFYRQQGDDSVELLAGSMNIVSGSDNRVRVRVTRDNAGLWAFWADPTGHYSFLPQGEVRDTVLLNTQWFGFTCKYTVSNAQRFYFDDLKVGEFVPDTTVPVVTAIRALDNYRLEVHFSKPVEPTTAQRATNYFVPGGVGKPDAVEQHPTVPSAMLLSFSVPFTPSFEHELHLMNIADYAGNLMQPFIGTFTWYQARRFDVVFSELMVNPTPENGLPGYEYVELYNTSDFELHTEGWVFQHGNTQRPFPTATIPPKGFLVFTTSNGLESLAPYGNVIHLPGLSSTALTNTGATLMLFDQDEQLLAWVAYSDAWYGDADKASGGWSLEKIDLYNFCAGQQNWTASKDLRGGTPGEPNSVSGHNPDTVAPKLLGVMAENPLEITVYFDKTLDEASLSNPLFYSIEGSNPLAVAVNEPYFNQASLFLSKPLQPSRAYTLQLDARLTDCAGNSLSINSSTFAFHTPQRHDVVFNEIMADPTPVVGLPAQKYLEIYNTTTLPLNLQDWVLTHGTTRRTLPFIQIEPKSYTVLTTSAAYVDLQTLENVYAVPSLSTNFLTIGGLALALESPQGTLIDAVNYHQGWYGDASKSGGGWSLEKIDPYNFCGGAFNWKASVSNRGGTPGTANSVQAHNPDNRTPLLLRAGIVDDRHISLVFDKAMDEDSTADPVNYFISNQMGIPLEARPVAPWFKEVVLGLPSVLLPEIHYEITISEHLMDCAGLSPVIRTTQVALPQKADSLDVVFNEILFNPPTNGVRYVELYNRSQKVIDLKDYIISSMDTIANIFTSVREISPVSHLFFPGQYRVLTPEPAKVKSHYMTYHPLWFIETELPTMTNTRGVLVFASKGRQILDMMVYEEDMHYALLTDKKGVALERINYHLPTRDPANWHSAAQGVGFGTPAYKNSQFTLLQPAKEGSFELYPEIFTPDNDGHDDVLNIAYQFEKPGYTANINIYDSRGRLVKALARGVLLGTSGVITWDGTNQAHQKAAVGIYIVYIEAFNPQGEVLKMKKTTVLGARL